MGGSGAGGQGQIHLHPGVLQPTGHRYRDVVHPGNVAQGAEGRDLLPQAHQLIDVLLAVSLQKAAVLRRAVAALVDLRRQQLQIHQGIKGQSLPLLIQHDLQHRQIKPGPVLILLLVGGKATLREEDVPDIPVAKRQPSVGRSRGQLGQNGGAQIQNLTALQPTADGQQGQQLLRPARRPQQLNGGPSGRGIGELLRRQGLRHLQRNLSHPFFLHGFLPSLTGGHPPGSAFSQCSTKWKK